MSEIKALPVRHLELGTAARRLDGSRLLGPAERNGSPADQSSFEPAGPDPKLRALIELTKSRRQLAQSESQVAAQMRAIAKQGAAAPEPERLASARALLDVLEHQEGRRTEASSWAQQLPGRTGRLLDTFGRANPDALPGSEVSVHQLRAIHQLVVDFQSSDRLSLAPGTLQPGVVPASPRVLAALANVLRTPYSSVDPSGAANVEHLGCVFRGVLEYQTAALGHPLTQEEADKLAMQTVLTDAWMKGRTLPELVGMPTMPTNRGATVGDIDAAIKRIALERVEARGPLSGPVRDVIAKWIDAAQMPMDPDSVYKAAGAAGLTPDQTDELVKAWGGRIMGTGDWVLIQGFMRGVILHGLPSFELIRHAVAQVGGHWKAEDVAAAVVGHHAAAFVQAPLGKLGLMPDFAAMEASGVLPPGLGAKLQELYGADETLAAQYRPRVDQAIAQNGAMSSSARKDYRAAAKAYRDAIAALPPEIQAQIFADDEMQFTPKGMAKWILMQNGKTTQDLLAGVYRAAQAYYEEAMARDLSDRQPGRTFRERTETAAQRLGFVHDDRTSSFRPANAREPPFKALARSLRANPEARALLRERLGVTDKALDRISADRIVEAFRTAPTDTPERKAQVAAILVRLAAGG